MNALANSRWKFLVVWFIYLVATTVLGQLISIGIAMAPPSGLDTLSILLVTLIEACALVWCADKFIYSGWQLWWRLLSIFHGIKTFLMMIEAYAFLNLWVAKPLMTLNQVLACELQGLLIAGVVCGAAAWLKARDQEITNIEKLSRPNALRFLSVSALYVVLYFLAGAFILIPLAGHSFDATYSGLKVPAWMPLLQLARGLVFAMLLWIFIASLSFRGARVYWVTSLVLVIVSTSQLWLPNPFMQSDIRWAHWIEMAVSMGIFGWLSAKILSVSSAASTKMTVESNA